MEKRRWLVTTATALSLAFVGTAYAAAEEQEQEMAPRFEEVDADQNGVISKGEAAKVPGLDFASADANRDGVLSKSEYMAAIS